MKLTSHLLNTSFVRRSSAVLACAATFPVILSGQAIPEGKKIEKKDTTYSIQQVSVTAMRYREAVMEVPLAVSLIGRDEFQNKRGYGLDDATMYIPGVLTQSRYGNQDVRLTIRGFGARGAGDRSNAGTSRGIRVLIDGIPETEPDGRTAFDHVDLGIAQTVEILRSNASAVWGNAAGGVLNISTVPLENNAFADVEGQIGSFGYQKLMLRLGSPLGNNGAKVYGNVVSTTFDGWRNSSASERLLLNAGVFAPLGEKTVLGISALASSNKFNIPGPLDSVQFTDNPQQANPNYALQRERRFNRLGRLGVTLEHEFSPEHSVSAMVFANPKYLERSERNTFRQFTRYHFGGNALYKWTTNVSSSIKSRLIAGLDNQYQDGAILFYTLDSLGNQGTTLRTNKREGANSFGAFVQEELTFSDKLSLIIGARYDQITYFYQNFPGGSVDPAKPREEKAFTRITPKAGISYRLSDRHTLYANLGGGVEVPAGNEVDPTGKDATNPGSIFNQLLEPVQSTTIEIGSKQVIPIGSFIHSLAYDVCAYWIGLTNDIVPYNQGRYYLTAGKTERLGFELGMQATLEYGISLRGQLTMARHRYSNYIVDSLYTATSKPGQTADLSNNKTAGIPETFWSASARYLPRFLQNTALENLYLEFGAQGVSSYFADDRNTITVPSYLVCNATIGLMQAISFAGGAGVRVFATVNNVFDAQYAASAFVNPDIVSGRARYIEPGLPRNVALGVALSWR